MDILFIGGTGFFGKAFLSFIKINNPRFLSSLTIVGRSAPDFLKINKEFDNLKNIRFIYGDILKDLSHLNDHSYTHIIHAAADSTNVSDLSSIDRYQQIVDGSKNVLSFVRDYCPESKFLFVSSRGVYGSIPTSSDSFTESDMHYLDILDSSNVYSMAKRTAEHLCSLYHDEYNLKISIVRCFCFSGINLPLDVHFAIGNFVLDAIKGNDIVIKGDGMSVRSYLDQDDLVEWMIAVLRNDSFNLTTYNIGSEERITIKDLAFLVQELSNKGLDVKILNQNKSAHKRSTYVPNCKKIKEKFNLVEKVSLSNSIIKMIDKKIS